MEKGKLYLIPSLLSNTSINYIIPIDVIKKAKELKYFIVENIRTTRRYLKKIDKSIDIDTLEFYE